MPIIDIILYGFIGSVSIIGASALIRDPAGRDSK